MRPSAYFYSILMLLMFSGSEPAASLDSGLCQIAGSAIAEASSIRGLKPRRQIPCHVHDRDKVKDYLLATIKDKLPPNRLKMEGLAYKILGLVPASLEYERTIVDFYLGQIGGYYDPEKKHFIMAGWMPEIMQTTVAVHELTHGLQDQYYDLEKFMDMKLENSDELLARSSLVEGDATCVMLDYAKKLSNQPPLSREGNIESFMMQSIIGASLMSGGANVPESMRLMVIFPYTSGTRFAHEMLRKGGYKELDRAFKNPPSSTEEILHIEKYANGRVDYVNLNPEDFRPTYLSPDARVVYQDTLGEFVISTLLGMGQKDRGAATRAAAGWGGDRVAIFQPEKSQSQQTLVWQTHWDTKGDSEEFYDSFLKSLKNRFSDAEQMLNINGSFVTFQCAVDEASQSCAS